jgi:hypothetical protein
LYKKPHAFLVGWPVTGCGRLLVEHVSADHVRPHSGKLKLLDLDKWNKNKTYNKKPPTCLYYSIKWKVILNNKLLSKDTEPDLVLAPRFY